MRKIVLCLVMLSVAVSACLAEDLQKVISYYQPAMDKGFIYVSKLDMTLTLVGADGKVVVTYPMACGRNKGHKQRKGDFRTPEGKFSLQQIQDASTWSHDFNDGKGVIKNAYGPYFMRLKTGFSGIGIHGTHDPASIGTRATEGCIRLNNENVAALQKKVTLGMPVIIGPEKGVASLPEKTLASASAKPVKDVTPVKEAKPAKPAKEASASTKPVKEVKPAKVVTEEKSAYADTLKFAAPAWCWPPKDPIKK